MTRTDVQKLYSLAGGRWWDPFRAHWELVWARNAVRDLDSLLRRYVTPEARVLDLGCGSGANLARLRRLRLPLGHYTGVDLPGGQRQNEEQESVDSCSPAVACATTG